MKKIFLYPIWLRLWHWLNALLFLILILSGISLHFSDSGSLIVPFRTAIVAHNICGLLVSALFLYYTIMNIVSGNYKHYIPKLRNIAIRLYKQTRFYILGIFLGEPHPYHASIKNKFNPMQQISYFFIVFFGMPAIIISGILLLFPELAPDEFYGMGGIWPMALLHTIVGFFLSIFMVAHIYLATTGHTIGDLFKSMFNGWHLIDELHDNAEEIEQVELILPKLKLLSSILYNPFSLTGLIIALFSILMIVMLIVIQFFTQSDNPYSQIVSFIIFPVFLLLGLTLIILGLISENRKVLSQKERKLPVIDLNNPRHQIKAVIISVASILFVILSVYGSFSAYDNTDSNEFCGEVCHEVMHPEYAAYETSPHSRVACVDCHISSQEKWLVKSKFSGLYQVYSVMFDKYSKPIKAPIKNLRPTQQTCEKCHWPTYFYNEKNKNYTFYLSDEKNTEHELSMLIKVGGGNSDLGLHDGIHWHMSINNEIKYYATDDKLTNIPWVLVKSRTTGKETIYKQMDTIISDEIYKSSKLRTFDCVDCHNRPSHIFRQPNKVINAMITNNKIDKTLPYIKRLGVQALENYVGDRQGAFDDISKFIWGYYDKQYPDLKVNKKIEIDKAIIEFNNIYQKNYYPEMNVNWKSYTDNINHLYSKACFRCHDGKHVNSEGEVLPHDCNFCHTISHQKAPGIENKLVQGKIKFIHPGGIDKMVETRLCSDCHSPHI